MSIGSLGGVLGSAAGAPLSQSKGSDVERTGQDSAASERQVESSEKAEKAAGIGQTEEDQEASDRDADGRRLWEQNQEEEAAQETQESDEQTTPEPRQSKDATGLSGNTLDLTG